MTKPTEPWAELDADPFDDMRKTLERLMSEAPKDPLRGSQSVTCSPSVMTELRELLEKATPTTRMLVGAVRLEVDPHLADGFALFRDRRGDIIGIFDKSKASIFWLAAPIPRWP